MKKTKKNGPVGTLEDAALQCRDFGHAWRWKTDFNPMYEGKRMATVTRYVACERCGTGRLDVYALPTFKRIKTTYDYEANYLLTDHTGRLAVSEVRIEIMRRIMSGDFKH